MRFYTIQHQFSCGIDLHVDWMYLGGIDADGEVHMPPNLRTDPHTFLQALRPVREEVVVCGECLFTWSWLADLCEDEGRALRPGPCPLQAGDSRRHSQERPP
jgi:hypothetical protein